MLYRAAELTTQHGFDWFIVLDRDTEHNVRTIVRPDPFYRPWYGAGYTAWRPNWDVYVPGYGWNSMYGDELLANPEFNVRHIEAFETSAQIQMERAPLFLRTIRARLMRARCWLTSVRPLKGPSPEEES